MAKDNILDEFIHSDFNEKVYYLPAIISEIIFKKDIYSKNIDLKIFTSKLNLEYKDYLFKSRTLLYSRVIKDVYVNNKDYKTSINQILSLINKKDNKNANKKDNKNANKKKNKSQKDIINEWRQIINPDD